MTALLQFTIFRDAILSCPSALAVRWAEYMEDSGTNTALLGGAIAAGGTAGAEALGGGPEDPLADYGASLAARFGTKLAVGGTVTAYASASWLAANGLPRDAINTFGEAVLDKTILRLIPVDLQPVSDQGLDTLANSIEDWAAVWKDSCSR